MERRRVTSASVAGLLVVVVGIAAATLESTRGGSPGGAHHPVQGDVVAGGSSVATPSVPFVEVVLPLLAVVLAVGIVRYRRSFVVATVGAGVGLAVLLGIYAVLLESGETDPEPLLSRIGESILKSAPVVDTEPGTAEGVSQTTPVVFVLVALVAVIGLGALVAYWTDGGSPMAMLAGGVDEDDDEALAAVGRRAGRAADRLEGADAGIDNEVYRAWDDMTAHLDVDGAGARTPGEFRTAALDAGMVAADVDALTGLFEAVRYGGADPTGSRERDAVAALRRIEGASAEGE